MHGTKGSNSRRSHATPRHVTPQRAGCAEGGIERLARIRIADGCSDPAHLKPDTKTDIVAGVEGEKSATALNAYSAPLPSPNSPGRNVPLVCQVQYMAPLPTTITHAITLPCFRKLQYYYCSWLNNKNKKHAREKSKNKTIIARRHLIGRQRERRTRRMHKCTDHPANSPPPPPPQQRSYRSKKNGPTPVTVGQLSCQSPRPLLFSLLHTWGGGAHIQVRAAVIHALIVAAEAAAAA